ncbi:MAG: enoyl-CoA hydratase/isomerase family protein [Thaumarchaeota archaeon]|nr:enoyl-CoA hydratase/isomerase family protein [Nitrososphaerota archaeon]
MSEQNVLAEVKDRVLFLTLNRPKTLNLLDVQTRKDILRALKDHRKNDGTRCVVVSARGEVFSAGADLNHLLKLNKTEAKAYTKFVRSILDYVESYPKPTIGVVEGLAVGGGLELLLALDIVLASPEAKFGLTELNVGLIPGGGGSQRLPRLVGIRKAKEMIFTGSLISAQEALELRLVNRVVPKESLWEEVTQLCERIVLKSPLSLRVAKEAINETFYMELREGLDRENRMYPAVLTSEEARERIRGFLERRKSLQTKG